MTGHGNAPVSATIVHGSATRPDLLEGKPIHNWSREAGASGTLIIEWDY